MMSYTYYPEESNKLSAAQTGSIAAYKDAGFSDADAVQRVARLYNVKESYIWGLLENWREHQNEPRFW